MSSTYDLLCNMVIRPKRDNYPDECLGPKYLLLEKAGNMKVVHSNIRLKNTRGLTLRCSFYEPYQPPETQVPCVIFLHGNSSSRVDALSLLDYILPQNISLFCFDFAGSGKSEGEYVSLGYHERHDVSTVVDFLKRSGRVSSISLWGRSMGAATALLYGAMDPAIKAIVADSPFSDLQELAKQLVDNYINVPKMFFKLGFSIIQSSIEEKAHMKIEELNILRHIEGYSSIPILFVYARMDNFIKPDHCKQLFERYKGPKELLAVEGNHNTSRVRTDILKVMSFLDRNIFPKKIMRLLYFPSVIIERQISEEKQDAKSQSKRD